MQNYRLRLSKPPSIYLVSFVCICCYDIFDNFLEFSKFISLLKTQLLNNNGIIMQNNINFDLFVRTKQFKKLNIYNIYLNSISKIRPLKNNHVISRIIHGKTTSYA